MVGRRARSDALARPRRAAVSVGNAITPIAIPDDVRAAIYAHARAEYPAECCGYLVGRDGVERAVACHNAQASGANPAAPERGADAGFVIAGAELFALVRSLASDAPARILYHSHPNGRAYFSTVDREVAAAGAYPVQHVVVGVTATGVTEVAQFAWSTDAVDFIEVARWQP